MTLIGYLIIQPLIRTFWTYCEVNFDYIDDICNYFYIKHLYLWAPHLSSRKSFSIASNYFLEYLEYFLCGKWRVIHWRSQHGVIITINKELKEGLFGTPVEFYATETALSHDRLRKRYPLVCTLLKVKYLTHMDHVQSIFKDVLVALFHQLPN